MKNLALMLIAAMLASNSATAVPSGPPSSSNPNGVLPLLRANGETPFAKPREIRAKLMREVPLAAKAVERMQAALRAGDLRKLKRLEVAKVYVELTRLRRGAKHLALWSEPSSVGFGLELGRLMKDHHALITAMKEDEFHKARLSREKSASSRAVERKKSIIERTVDPLVEKGQVAKAHEALLPLGDDLMSVFVFYDRKDFETSNSFLEKRLSETTPVYRDMQIREVLAGVGAMRDKYAPNYDRLWRGVEDIILKVKNAEPVEAGPVLMKKFASGWSKTQLSGLRCQAYDWTLGIAMASFGGEEKDAWIEKSKKHVEAHNKFTEKMGELIVALIEADLNRSTPEQIEKLYPEYLEALSLLVALNGKEFREQVRTALDKMATKSTSLSQQIADYRAATDDLLRWRRRVAQAQAAKAKQTFSSLEETFQRAALRSEDATERLLKDEKAPLATLAINSFARTPTNFVSRHILNSKVFVGDGIGFRSAGGYPLMTRRANRHYAGFRGDPNWITKEVTRLESDLLVDQSRPVPLSFDAQLALASARRGDVQSAGGRVTGMMLESIITRQTNLVPSDWGMVRIEPLEGLPKMKNSEKLKQVQARFAINPLWLQNEYFFVDLSDNDKKS